MFDKAREQYYEKLLGVGMGRAFVEFEEFCAGLRHGNETLKRVLEWIQTVETGDRQAGLQFARAHFELPRWQEEAIGAITERNQLERMADGCRARLAGAELRS